MTEKNLLIAYTAFIISSFIILKATNYQPIFGGKLPYLNMYYVIPAITILLALFSNVTPIIKLSFETQLILFGALSVYMLYTIRPAFIFKETKQYLFLSVLLSSILGIILYVQDIDKQKILVNVMTMGISTFSLLITPVLVH